MFVVSLGGAEDEDEDKVLPMMTGLEWMNCRLYLEKIQRIFYFF